MISLNLKKKISSKLYLVAILLFLTMNLFAQNKWHDALIIEESCNTMEILEGQENTLNFYIGFKLEGFQGNSIISRVVHVEFRSGITGVLLKSIPFQFVPFNSDHLIITNEHLEGLPYGYIKVSLRISYTLLLLDGNSEIIEFMGTNQDICDGTLTLSEPNMVCIVENVLCFNYQSCPTVDIVIDFDSSSKKFKATPSGGSGNYSYSWFIEDHPGGGNGMSGGNMNTVDVDECEDRRYTVTITDLENECVYEQHEIWLSLAQCGDCLIAIPTGLESSIELNGSVVLTWDPTAGATSYVVVINMWDPECCPIDKDKIPYKSYHSVSEETFTVNIPHPKAGRLCFSWYIKALCDTETTSGQSYSEKMCATNWWAPGTTKGINSDDISINLFPNPSRDRVNIRIDHILTDNINYRIIDLYGNSIEEGELTVNHNKAEYDWLPSLDTRKGIYILQLISNETFVERRIILIE